MFKDKFDLILDKEEEIKWCNNINISAYVKKNVCKTFLFGLFPPFAMLLLGIPYTLVILVLSLLNIIELWIGIAHFIFSIFACAGYVLYLKKYAANTFFCITNKRIIKRSGAFNNKFIHYSLKNVGNIEVSGSMFDSKGNEGSATLIVSVKEFHSNSDGNKAPLKLYIESLNNAYDAYKYLSKEVEGNNDVIRIKQEQ